MAGALQGSLSMVGKQKMEGQVDARAPDFGQKIANTITSDRQWAQPKPGNGQIGDFRSQGMGKLETSGNPFWDMKPDVWQEYRKTSNDWNSSMSDTSPAMPDEMQENNQLLWGIDGWVDNTLEEDGGLKILCVEEALASQEWMGESPSVDVLISILHKCRKSKHLGAARCLHMHIHLNGLETQIALGNHLVQMFIECGSVSDAQQVFLRLVQRNEYSWTSLMQGYIECGESQHVFVLFQKMQEDGVYPSRYTFLILLKACARLKCVERGQEIQAEITKDGFERDAFIGNSLVDMYTKCGSLVEAREVFENLASRNAISWNALIAGYAEHSLSEEALKILDKMQLEGTPPNAITSLGSLKACSSLGAINRGQEIHAEMAKKGHERDIFVSSTLVDTYAKCGLLTEAHKVFDGIQVRGVVSWTALIAGYAEYGLGEEALNCLEEMRSEGVSPNAVTYVCSLKACGSMQAINKGRELYMEIVRAGFEKDPFVINSLIDMYAKCDLILEAKGMFDVMPAQDVVSWNTLISGYVEQGLGEDALDCWEQMQQKGVLSNFVTFVCSLKACGILGAKEKGQEVHMEIAKEGLELDSFMGSSLVDMYSNCGLLTEAQEVFDKLGIRDVVSWNALIAGYAEHGQGEEALNCLQRMRLEDELPDDVTFMFSLKACSSIGAIGRGSASHIEIVKGGFESDPFVGNTLVDMYAKCGSLAEAQKVFDELPVQTVVLWNALIAGYSEHGLDEEVMICMENMQVQGVSPNGVTYVCILKACGSLSAKDKSRVWHADIVKEELERDQFVGSALVDTYAKCGLLAEAQGIFDELQVRDVVSWSALIAGYAVHGLGEEALSCLQQMQLEDVPPNVVSWNGVISGYSEQGESEKAFSVYAQMQEQGILPNGVTFLSILKACGSTTDLKLGIAIHSQIYGFGVVEADEKTLATGLIDMYGKCGCMVDAQRVFDAMPAHDLMRWTALVASYARQGESELVLCLLDRMKEEGIQPNEITFLKVLSVCSHAGLVEKGHLYFEVMSRKYDITPTLEHYNCMVDLLARAGQLDEAVAMLEKMPFVPNLATWTALLGACRKWGNVKLGRHAFECVVNLDSKHVVPFILMSNIYAEANMWEDVKKIEEMRTSIQALGRKG